MVAPISVVRAVADAAQVLTGSADDYDALLEQIGDARFVLIGEASHGTQEFYQERAAITRRLVSEKGFTAILAEADWPAALGVQRYVTGGAGESTDDALAGFDRFPRWMWRNTVLRDFVGFLRAKNQRGPRNVTCAGFFGMDLYSLYVSIGEVLSYLRQVDKAAWRRARDRYSCFEFFHPEPQHYGRAVSLGRADSCEDAAVAQLVEMERQRAGAGPDGPQWEDEFFFAQQNARLVQNAEAYYRSMYRGRASSWNLRDTHMADTVDALTTYLTNRDGHAKVVLWAHNSHLGDARATEMSSGGELNVGQLMRERHPGETFTIGFTTHAGTVMAADEWDGPGMVKNVRAGLPGSVEALFHATGLPRSLLFLEHGGTALSMLSAPLLQRAIGVIYRPETERQSHYFDCRIAQQFNAVIHIDNTRALEPLDVQRATVEKEVPETYPTGV